MYWTPVVVLWYPFMCLPLTSPDLLSLHLLHFCPLHIQVFSFQGIAHSFSQRPSRNPLPINYFRTLFVPTGGIPPLALSPSLWLPLCAKRVIASHLFSVRCALFQVPSPGSALLATLLSRVEPRDTKTAGYIPSLPNLEPDPSP